MTQFQLQLVVSLQCNNVAFTFLLHLICLSAIFDCFLFFTTGGGIDEGQKAELDKHTFFITPPDPGKCFS